MKTILSGILLFFFISVYPQTTSTQKTNPLFEAKPSEAGMSDQRLQRIDNMLSEAVKTQQIPGVVALIVRNDKIVYYKAFGMADNDKNTELKKDDIFRIASQSKAITSTAVMMLWEEGKFKLDDPISKYISEFKNPQLLNTFNERDSSFTAIPAKQEITIRHLLTHTSGLGYGFIDADERFKMIYQKAGVTDAFTTKKTTIEESVKRLAALPLHHNPGEQYTYSEGLDVLGYFIEVISGISFDKFLSTRIFKPLGMDDTGFYLPDSKAGRLVKVQALSKGKWVGYTNQYYDVDYPIKGAKTFFSGGGGLCSTAKDYATFLQMYLNGGEYNGVRLLSRTTIQAIMSDQMAELWMGHDSYYGLAFGVVNEKGEAKGGMGSNGTFNWGGYFNTQYFADPKEKVIGILMKQTQGPVPDETAWKFRILVGQAIDD